MVLISAVANAILTLLMTIGRVNIARNTLLVAKLFNDSIKISNFWQIINYRNGCVPAHILCISGNLRSMDATVIRIVPSGRSVDRIQHAALSYKLALPLTLCSDLTNIHSPVFRINNFVFKTFLTST